MSATAQAHFYILESPSIDADQGTALSIFNRFRASSNQSGVKNVRTETVNQATYFSEDDDDHVSGGTEIAHIHLGGGEKITSAGGSSRGSQEWILKQDTIYAFVIESMTDDDNTHLIVLDWYEHD